MWEDGGMEGLGKGGKGYQFHYIIRCNLERRCGMRVVMTYRELAECGLVWEELLKHQR